MSDTEGKGFFTVR